MKKLKLLVAVGIASASLSMVSYAGEWKQDTSGWWYQNDDGSYPTNTWQWIDSNQDGTSECYYFDSNGYILSDTSTPDGCIVNTDGAWIVDGVVQTQLQNTVPDESASQTNSEDPAPANNQAVNTKSSNQQNTQASSQATNTSEQNKSSNQQNTQTSSQAVQTSSSAISSVPYDGYTIIANTNTMKYHTPDCRAVKKMSPEHFGYASSASELIALGYTPCLWCH